MGLNVEKYLSTTQIAHFGDMGKDKIVTNSLLLFPRKLS